MEPIMGEAIVLLVVVPLALLSVGFVVYCLFRAIRASMFNE